MKKTLTLSLLAALSLLSACKTAQTPLAEVPRDTSFTVYSAFEKHVDRFPGIEIARPGLPAGVTAFENIPYTTIPDSAYGERRLSLDVYRPDDNETYPAYLLVHGGGRNSGDRSMEAPMAQQIAARGYVTIPVEYRLIPEALYPAGVHDLKTAVRWVRAHAGDYGIDPDRIAVSGTSAGGQLASLIGMTNGSAVHEGEGEYAEYSSDVQAVVNIDGTLTFVMEHTVAAAEEKKRLGEPLPINAVWLGGAYSDRRAVWEEASPLYWVSENAVPICFINGGYARYHDGRDEVTEKLDAFGIYSEVHEMEDEIHPFWLFHPWFDWVVDRAAGFLDKVFAPEAP